MAFGTSNRVTVALVEETTFGVTPVSPAFQVMRVTGEGLASNIKTTKSQELRSDRMTSDLRNTDSSPGGEFNLEFSAKSFDDILEAAMMDTWGATLTITGVAGDLALTTSSPHLTSATAGKFAAVVVGQWLKLVGFGADPLYFRVKTKTSPQTLIFDTAPLASVTPAGTTGLISGSMIRNGVTERSFTLLKEFEGIAVTAYETFTGQRVGSMALDMKDSALLTGSVSFKGKSSDFSTTPLAGQTFIPATTTTVMDCVNDLSDINQNGLTYGTVGSIKSINFSLDNQHREQKAVSVFGNAGVAAGTLMVTLSLDQYFEDTVQAQLFRTSSGFLVSFRLQGAEGDAYIFTFPKVKYTEYKANASGLDTDIATGGKVEAIQDPITNCMIQIDRFLMP